MMKVAEIAFVAYPVSEIENPRGFYEGVFGLQPSREFTKEFAEWRSSLTQTATRLRSTNDIRRRTNISHVYSG
jgi:extradiol dioxygenase family protein